MSHGIIQRIPVGALSIPVGALAALLAAGTALAADPQGDPNAYTLSSDSTPATRWNPCRYINYQVNDTHATAGALEDAQEAMRRVADANGFAFRYVGRTDIIPSDSTPAPDGIITIAWANSSQSDYLDPTRPESDVGGASSVAWGYDANSRQASHYTGGLVVMNTETEPPPGFRSFFATRGEALMHEIGHVMGLGHTDDTYQLMHSNVRTNGDKDAGEWGAGDLTGLRLLGARQGCIYNSIEEAQANAGSVPPRIDPRAESTATAAPTATPATSESPTATPTIASPTASPTRSDTPAAPPTTAQPSPAPPASNVVPAVSVNPFVVKFGQTANVTIAGTPGATVDLYIRKYLGSFINIRDGLVLDSTGRITVPTKPDQNLRFMAKDRTLEQGSSIGGTDGLMTVQKYVSINVKRASARHYTFTGSINPLHPGAVVHLYRNGTLIKSNIPISSSRIYSWTGTLPAGPANYRITSPTTGYNNLSHSPTRSVNIY